MADFTRRGFLKMFAAAATASMGGQHLARLLAGPDRVFRPADLVPDGYQAVRANPMFDMILAPDRVMPVWNDDKTKLLHTQMMEDGRLVVFSWDPETPTEWADANEYFDVYHWRAWRTPAELEAVVSGGGKWLVRSTLYGINFGVIEKGDKAAALAGPVAEEDTPGWTEDLDAAAEFTSAEAVIAVGNLTASLDPEGELHYEPVRRADAFKDLRLKQLRTSGWGPQSGGEFDLAELHKSIGAHGSGIGIQKCDDGWFIAGQLGESEDGDITMPHGGTVYWSADIGDVDDDEEDVDDDEVDNEDDDTEAQSDDRRLKVPPGLGTLPDLGLVHVFLRPNADAPAGSSKYRYIGLGHTDGPAVEDEDDEDGIVVLRVEPRTEPGIYAALGGDVSWSAVLTDAEDAGNPTRVEKIDAAGVDDLLSRLDKIKNGKLELNRWGPTKITVGVGMDIGFITTYQHCFGSYQTHWYVDADGPYAAMRFESDAIGDQAVAAPAVIGREKAAELLKKLFDRNGDPPYSDNWTTDPFGTGNSPASDEGDAGETYATPGHVMPPLLKQFGEWFQQQEPFCLGAFEWEVGEPYWNDETKDRLSEDGFTFLMTGDQSYVMLLNRGDGNPPAVCFLGSEGDAQTLATSLESFLLKLAAAETGVMDLDEPDRPAREELKDWLTENNVRAPDAKPFDFEAYLEI